MIVQALNVHEPSVCDRVFDFTCYILQYLYQVRMFRRIPLTQWIQTIVMVTMPRKKRHKSSQEAQTMMSAGLRN